MVLGDPDASSGNYVASIRCILVLDRCLALTTNLWYPSAINYKLMVSFSVASISTLTMMGSVGATRLDEELRGFDPTFMDLCPDSSATLDLDMKSFLMLLCRFLEGIKDLDKEI